jgi:hypothetical protein
VRKLLVLVVVLLAIAGSAAASSWAVLPASPPPCGLPNVQPMWIDYADGQVPFWQQIFAHPGIVAAASKLIVPPQLRAAGAQTVYFDLDLNNRVGTPSAPANPALMVSRADSFYNAAVASTGCATPFIAENELSGAQTPTPWTPTITQYRSNISAFLGELAAKGARPFLLLSQAPYTQGDAGLWFQQIAQVADLVPEVYFSGKAISALTPTAAAKKLRATMRTRVEQLASINIPSQRIGMMLTFSSTPGAGGREGLQPLSAWLNVVQEEVAAAKDVSSELKLATIWSWGWATFNAAGADPDKATVACVYLWARDPTLCDAPSLAGANLTTAPVASAAPGKGQLCVLGTTPISANDVTELTAVTGDRDVAFSAAFQRLMLVKAAPLANGAVAAAESEIINDRFAGDRASYVAALKADHATMNIGRDVLGDQLRQQAVEATLRTAAPTAAQVASFYSSYAGQPARTVKAAKSLSWLGSSSGVALQVNAPANLFTLPTGGSATVDGVAVTAVGPTISLAAIPLVTAQNSIRAALTELARGVAFDSWLVKGEAAAAGNLSCSHDKLPDAAPVDLTDYLPFLSLG